MSYYIIDGTPVFLTWSRYYQLREEIIKRYEIGDERFFGLRCWTSQEAVLLSSVINEILLEKFQTDIKAFNRQWTNFNMDKDEAADNAWELLFDYCQLTRNAVLTDLTSTVSLSPDGNSFPVVPGRVFALSLPAPEKSFFKRLFGGTRLLGRLVIDSEQINSIQGTLKDFLLVYRNMPMRFSKAIEIG